MRRVNNAAKVKEERMVRLGLLARDVLDASYLLTCSQYYLGCIFVSLTGEDQIWVEDFNQTLRLLQLEETTFHAIHISW